MGLTQEAITQAALHVLDKNGLDGMTVRMIAAELNVQAPALYWHVKDKQELIDRLAATMIRDGLSTISPRKSGEPWVEWLAAVANTYRNVMLSYRDGARILLDYQASDPSKERLTELVLRALTDAGLPLAVAARAFNAVVDYTTGHAAREQARCQQLPSDKRQDPGLFPLSTAASSHLPSDNAADDFNYGLMLLLSGLRLARLGK